MSSRYPVTWLCPIAEVDWKEWEEHKEFVRNHKNDQKIKLRNLLESDIKSITMSLKELVDSIADDEYKCDMMDMMEEALMKIADCQGDPIEIASNALKKLRGEENPLT